jgi:hypothetical protein
MIVELCCIVDFVHAAGECTLESVENVLDRTINWVVRSSEDNLMAPRQNEANHSGIVVYNIVVTDECSTLKRDKK